MNKLTDFQKLFKKSSEVQDQFENGIYKVANEYYKFLLTALKDKNSYTSEFRQEDLDKSIIVIEAFFISAGFENENKYFYSHSMKEMLELIYGIDSKAETEPFKGVEPFCCLKNEVRLQIKSILDLWIGYCGIMSSLEDVFYCPSKNIDSKIPLRNSLWDTSRNLKGIEDAEWEKVVQV